MGSFAIELVYLILAVVAFRLLMDSGARPRQYVVLLVAVASAVAGFYGALKPVPHNSSNYNYEALYWTIALLVLAAVRFGAARVMRPNSVRNAARHAAGHHGVPPLDETLGFEREE